MCAPPRPLRRLTSHQMRWAPVVLAPVVLGLSGVMASTQTVQAQHAVEATEQAHIRLVLEGTWPAELAEGLTRDLRASLRERGIAMEVGESSETQSLARVRIDAAGLATLSLRIVVEDALTRKIVERAMSLEGVPPDVWSVLVSAAADELLRASWVELSMPDAPPPAQEVPRVVEEAIASSVAPPAVGDGAWGLGVAATAVISEGANFLGARLALSQASLAPLTFTLGLGAAGMIPMQSARARMDAVWLFVDVETAIELLPRTRGFAARETSQQLRLSLVLGARGGPLFAQATAQSALLEASDGVATVIVLDGGFRGGLTLFGDTQLTLGALVGAPLMGVSLSDGEEDVARLSGITVRAELGIEVWL